MPELDFLLNVAIALKTNTTKWILVVVVDDISNKYPSHEIKDELAGVNKMGLERVKI